MWWRLWLCGKHAHTPAQLFFELFAVLGDHAGLDGGLEEARVVDDLGAAALETREETGRGGGAAAGERAQRGGDSGE